MANSTTAGEVKASKTRIIAFWIITGLLSFELLFGALWDFNLLQKGYAGSILKHLGYPSYLAFLLGAGKILAAVALLVPGFARLKEWAYAGVVILFFGAVFSHVSTGDGPGKYGMAALCLTLTVISWLLRYRDKLK
ncbi:MAG TPA: DoxX family protein [Mucilaginibacter sp.]